MSGEARPVRVLPEALANQIAAGEVVERPASVVKELVENALDAGARRIRIDLEGGGVDLVRVADDGAGMSREDGSAAVLRHATSKIAELEDLAAIRTFGFRGEALPSIASVSRFALSTRRREDDEGTEVRIEGGSAPSVLPCGTGVGTTVEVRDLFFNVPARRKFLRAVGTETAHVTEVAQALALGEPSVAVVLARDGKVAREWLRTGSREDRVRAVFPNEELAFFRGERGPVRLEALLSRPERARNGTTGLWIFVNGRPVRDRQLARAIAQAYGSVLESGRYPLGAVYLEMPAELVDVNVHPQKAEVRFADGRAVADAVFEIAGGEIAEAFGLPKPTRGGAFQRRPVLFPGAGPPAAAAWIWDARPEAPAPKASGATPEPDPWGLSPLPAPGEGTASLEPGPASDADLRVAEAFAVGFAHAGASAAESTAGASPASAAEGSFALGERPRAFGALRFLAQVRASFLVCEGDDGIYLLDQHAAAERVTFHRLRTAYDARAVASQNLLFPEMLTVAAAEVALVEDAQDAIARTGLDVRPAGSSQLAVHAVPRLLVRASPERLVRDLLGELSRSGERAFSGAVDLALATMACHGSVRAGDAMTPEEARALLDALDDADFSGHCPHGRPVVMRVSYRELEHRVGRR